MKNHRTNSFAIREDAPNREAGFSLLELLTAIAVFMVIGGAAVSLFRQHVPMFTAQQSQTAVNIAARNAAAQIQIDLVNAGTGFYQGANIPTLPVGISILPGTNFGACTPGVTQNYTAACFDTLSIITIDTSAPPLNPSNSTGLAGTYDPVVSASSTLYGALPAGSAFTLAQIAAQYKKGDEILFVNGGVNNPGTRMAVAVLTADATVAGNTVVFQHSPAATYTDSVSGQSYTDDYYNLGATISNNAGASGTLPATDLNANDSYASATPPIAQYPFTTTDWILKIRGTTYGISLANAADPTLVRSQDNGATQFVADQIIGFRVGGYANDNNANPTPGWYYDTTTYDLNTTSAVRISLIGRTNPTAGKQDNYQNTFDGGSYRVEGVSIVVNPRNLSMNN